MAVTNALITHEMIAQEALFQLKNELPMLGLVYRAHEQEFQQQPNGFKKGNSIRIRKPVKYQSFSGAMMQEQGTVQGEVRLTVDRQEHVPLQFTVQELTFDISQFSELHLQPAVRKLAQKIELDLMSLYKRVFNAVGTPGQLIDSHGDYLKGQARLTDMAVPLDKRCLVCTPSDRAAFVASLPHQFYANSSIPEDALRLGRFPSVDGNTMNYESQLVRMHQNGSFSTSGASAAVNGTITAVTYASVKEDVNYKQTIPTDGWTNSAAKVLREGDIITFAGVFAVNPESQERLSYLRQFVVRADVDANGSGQADVVISPPMITSGPDATCSNVPVDNAVITPLGVANAITPQNLLFHKHAFALAVVPLEKLQGITDVQQITDEGLSITLTPVADPKAYTQAWRLDVLYGFTAQYPELATRLYGT